MSNYTWFGIGVVCLLVLATTCDLRTGRIPNLLNLLMLIVALLYQWQVGVLKGACVGAGVAGGLFLLFWICGAVGGGDVKLMCGVGAALGWPQVVDGLVYISVVGGILALVYIVWHRMGAKRRQNSEEEPSPKGLKASMPYSMAILAGYFVAVIL